MNIKIVSNSTYYIENNLKQMYPLARFANPLNPAIRTLSVPREKEDCVRIRRDLSSEISLTTAKGR